VEMKECLPTDCLSYNELSYVHKQLVMMSTDYVVCPKTMMVL